MNKKRKVTIVAGEGGHLAQAKRFISLDSEFYVDVEYILITDSKIKIPNTEVYLEKNISKYTKQRNILNLLMFFVYYMRLFVNSFIYIVSKKPKVLISFGPILAIPYLFWGKLFGIQIIHVETWSRFYSKSFAGKFAYYLADKFIIQNLELKNLYPNSIYGGRL